MCSRGLWKSIQFFTWFSFQDVYEIKRVKQKRNDETFAHETNVFKIKSSGNSQFSYILHIYSVICYAIQLNIKWKWFFFCLIRRMFWLSVLNRIWYAERLRVVSGLFDGKKKRKKINDGKAKENTQRKSIIHIH